MGEILKGATYDIRGLIWSTAPGTSCYMTRFAPNKFQDFYGLENGADRLNIAPVCVNEPGQMLPCVVANNGQGSNLLAFSCSRSRHPGGVNVLLGDGSVKFVKETINPANWIALHSIASGEIISSDAY